jgi:NADPH-dependent glutamate synthase beta subunit-like oxidoreductase
VLACTVAVEAIGNRADAADWSAIVKTDDAGLVAANAKTGKTSARRVFAGGDIVRGPALVVEAVQDGKLAARAIGAALSQEVKA